MPKGTSSAIQFSAFLFLASPFFCLGNAVAATDLGKEIAIDGQYLPSDPAVTTYNGKKIMFMSGSPIIGFNGLGGIYSSVKGERGWATPRSFFTKPGCELNPQGQSGGGKSIFAKPACTIQSEKDNPLAQLQSGSFNPKDIPFVNAQAEAITRGYIVSSPSVVKHPDFDAFYMFYTMRATKPTQEIIENPSTHEKQVVERQPTEEIGVAYGKPCPDSADLSGLCWTDLSADRPLLSQKDARVKGGVSAVLKDQEFALYYRTAAPNSRLVRTVVDARDWRIKQTHPLSFQENHPILKTWKSLQPHEQIGIENIDVKPYGKGFMMVSNDFSSHAIGRWKSEDGVNFYRDPSDANSPVVSDQKRTLSDPYLEVTDKNKFTIYYTSSNAEGMCAITQKCPRKIVEHHLSEETNPKIFENYYFSDDYVKPDYNTTTPTENR